jgi:hypothetical protein
MGKLSDLLIGRTEQEFRIYPGRLLVAGLGEKAIAFAPSRSRTRLLGETRSPVDIKKAPQKRG